MLTPHGTTKLTAPKMGGKRKRLKRLHLSPAENGGFIVKHHFHPEHGGTPAPESHVFAAYPDAHAHLERTMRGHKA